MNEMNEAGKTPPEQKPSSVAPSSPAVAGPPAQISIEEFQKVSLRTGVIVAAEDHPNAERLLILRVDIGEPSPRQLVAGIKGSYQAAELIGKQVIVVTNLKPAKLRGVESQGMALAASNQDSIVLLTLQKEMPPGSVVR